jgi:hypothetical protein
MKLQIIKYKLMSTENTNTDKPCTIDSVIQCVFDRGDKVRTTVSKNKDSTLRLEKKGSVGVIENIGISLKRRCYYIDFGDHKSWIYGDDLSAV